MSNTGNSSRHSAGRNDVLDVVVLVAFLVVKAESDPLVLYVSLAGLLLIFAGEKLFLEWREPGSEQAASEKGD